MGQSAKLLYLLIKRQTTICSLSTMERKESKHLEELLLDDSFVYWIKYGNDPAWDKWQNESVDNKLIAEKAHQVISAFKFKEDFPRAEKVELLKNKIDDNIILHGDANQVNWGMWAKWAAAIALVISAIAVFYNASEIHETKMVVQAYKLIEKSTHNGQKLTTNLPDGSKVMLNTNSKISYQFPFNGNERIIHLEGEAFFEVERDTLRPFRVISSGITTTALGTSFNINSKHVKEVDVSLLTGKVSVENSHGESVILYPGSKVIAMDSQLMPAGTFDYNQEFGWKDGLLMFRDASFPEIVNKLEDWYGVKVDLRGKIKQDIHYSGNYKNESLEEVLQGISFIYHFRYDISTEESKVDIYN